MSAEITKIAVFKGRHVRRILVKDEWWFSVVDVCSVLTDSPDPGAYWRKLKQRLKEEGSEVVTFCHELKLEASDGKKYRTDCANTEGIFRIIQSIPSPKAEPFKRWLARIGKERLDEIENPELGMQRTKEIYEKKGYPKDWIEKRLRGIAVRQKLTDEWDVRGAETDRDYAVLTNEIMGGAFDLNRKAFPPLQRTPGMAGPWLEGPEKTSNSKPGQRSLRRKTFCRIKPRSC